MSTLCWLAIHVGLSTQRSKQELAKTQGERFIFIKEEKIIFCRTQYCLQMHGSALPGAVGCTGIAKSWV